MLFRSPPLPKTPRPDKAYHGSIGTRMAKTQNQPHPSSFTGALLRLLFLVFPAPDPSWCFHFSLFYSFFFLFISSLFFSSFFTHVLHLLHSFPPSSSLISFLLFPSPFFFFFKESSYHNMSSIEAEIGETLKTSLRDA